MISRSLRFFSWMICIWAVITHVIFEQLLKKEEHDFATCFILYIWLLEKLKKITDVWRKNFFSPSFLLFSIFPSFLPPSYFPLSFLLLFSFFSSKIPLLPPPDFSEQFNFRAWTLDQCDDWGIFSVWPEKGGRFPYKVPLKAFTNKSNLSSFFFYFWNKVCLLRLGWSWTVHSPTSVFWVLGFYCIITCLAYCTTQVLQRQ